MRVRSPWTVLIPALVLLAPGAAGVRAQDSPAAEATDRPEGAESFAGPDPIPEVQLGPMLKTVPMPRNDRRFVYNVQMVDTVPLPRDSAGIWVLDFAFRPMRVMTVEIPGKGRRQVHYLYYRVINRTGKPRMFVPQFTLITNDTGKRYDDVVLPLAVPMIQNREDPTIPLLGAVENTGMLPPSTKEGVDDALFGVAIWEGVDPSSDSFSVYVNGLSDGQKVVTPPQGGEPFVQYKTLRIDFVRRGDERQLHEREIQLLDPPYEWIYWSPLRSGAPASSE